MNDEQFAKLFATSPNRFTGILYIEGVRGWHANCFDPKCWREWSGAGRGRGVWMSDPHPSIEGAYCLAKDHCAAEGHAEPAGPGGQAAKAWAN